MTKTHRPLRRRQGMTEYVVIVGLIAILLVGAVYRFRNSVNTAIQGSADRANGIGNDIDAGLSGSGSTVSGRAVRPDGASPTGYVYADDGTNVPASDLR